MLRSTGLRLLLILAVAAAFIVIAHLAGLSERWSGGIAGVLALAAAGLFPYLQSVSAKPSDHIDEAATERFKSLLTVAIACAIAAFAILTALAKPAAALLILAATAAWVLIWWLPRLRLISTTTGVIIARDPDVVFGFLSDFRTQLKYVPGVESVEKLTDGPIGLGTQFRTRARTRKGLLEGVEQITHYEPSIRYSSSLVSSVRPNAGGATFAPVPGGTQVTFQFESELSHVSALLGSGLLRWRLRRRLSATRVAVLARVKHLLESEAQPTTT